MLDSWVFYSKFGEFEQVEMLLGETVFKLLYYKSQLRYSEICNRIFGA